MEWLTAIFAHVCGQQNLWAPGGMALPFCQRCTGLYAGGVYALALCLLWRPRPTASVLWLHGGMMLGMIPFGFHLLPHGEVARTLSGYLFAFGMTYFLLLVPVEHFRLAERGVPPAAYWLALIACAPLLLLAAMMGGTAAAYALAFLGAAGLLAYAALVLLNAYLLASAARASLLSRAELR